MPNLVERTSKKATVLYQMIICQQILGQDASSLSEAIEVLHRVATDSVEGQWRRSH
ncbi:MAG: hypothetical protein M1415_11975 [Firmicutes bacterium]|nr:hypothetical protein [Bacillota bacterium]MCL5066158.1 hypothetical protein [Bacillota bacterium]